MIGVFQRLTSTLSIDEIHKEYDSAAGDLVRENDKINIANMDAAVFEACRVVEARDLRGVEHETKD